MTLSNSTVEYLKDRLGNAGVRTAAIVDDAFSGPTFASLKGDVAMFWNGIERSSGLRSHLESCGIAAQSEDDITEQTIAELWSRRREGTRLTEHANQTLFATALSSLEDVERISDSLRALGLEVVTVGTDYGGAPPVAGLVLMDYYLGDPADPTSPMLAVQRARELYDAALEDTEKPFIVLMSSATAVRAQAEQFRSDSNLLGGLFDVVSKSELIDPRRFAIRLAGWAANMPLRHRIQEFVESLDETLGHSISEFIRKARGLTIEDYFFVQALSLQSDGHPLGDYVQWLFGSLLVNKVFEANDRFAASRDEINRISLDLQPASHLVPSNHLAEIYSLAIAEPNLEEIGVHPRAARDGEEDGMDGRLGGVAINPSRGEGPGCQEELPLLRLGDLLVNKVTNRVYMIATPDCDLQFAPNTSRVPDRKDSVLLIPGQLCALRESSRRGQIETELYLHNGEQCRIVWDRRKILTIPIGEFCKWSADAGYSRPARIRLPYAVKIQQQVMAEVSRLGMPVAPPMQETVSADIFEHIDENTRQLYQSLDSGITLIHEQRGKPSFVVGRAALDGLLDRLSGLLEMYTESLASATGTRKQKLRNNLEKLERCLEPERLIEMLETKKKLPESGKSTQLVERTIGLHRGAPPENGCKNNHIVCLSITDA